MEKGSSSCSSSINGLKFGKKIYFEDVGNNNNNNNNSGLEVKASGGSPAKKGRSGVANGGQPPRCQVEGCSVDLSDAKAYYSRHKVCGFHSKKADVIVAGIKQRFCQQCSRFHKLPEFDNGKRSCRRRLACHNERRRKPPPGSLMSPHFGSLSPTTSLSPSIFDNPRKTGGFLMDFSAYSTPTGRESWTNPTSERGFGNLLPWQTNLQNHSLPNLLPSPTPRPSYSGPGVSSPVEGYTAVSDSSSALSLLSIQQPWGSSRTHRASNLVVNGFLGANANGTNLYQPSVNAIGEFNCPPDLGLGQISHAASGQYAGDLGLGQPNEGQFHDLDHHSRGYGSFV